MKPLIAFGLLACWGQSVVDAGAEAGAGAEGWG